MTKLSIVVPETTTNLITNPSFETNTTSWAAYNGAAIEQSSAQQRRGVFSLKCTPAGNGQGAYYSITLSVTTTYTISFDVYSDAAQEIVGVLYDTVAPVTLASETWNVAADTWYRLDFSATTGANAACALRIYTGASDDDIFYLDGVQIEEKSYATTYCDGSLRGHRGTLPGGIQPYKWNGAPHGSTSTRSAYTADGGRERDIEGLGGTYNIHLKQMLGAGIPRAVHNRQEYAMLDGARLQSIKTPERTLTLNFRANTVGGHDPNPGLYTAREQVENVLKHQRLPTLQPATLVWADTGNRIKAYYDTGLDGDYFGQGMSYEDFSLRMLAYRPWWFEDGQQGAELDFFSLVTEISGFIVRKNGQWQSLGEITGTTSPLVDIFALDPTNDARIWIGGLFTSIDGDGDNNMVTAWDLYNETFTPPGVGTNNKVRAIAAHPNGEIYLGGDFTTANGGAANYIVKYTPSTGTFTTLGAGTDDIVYAILIDPIDGNVYAGGAFLNAGGAAASRIAKWNIADQAWETLGTAPNDGLDGTVYCMAWGYDNKLYVGGSFAVLGDGATVARRLAIWDGSTWTPFGGTTDDGVGATVHDLQILPNGDVIIVGAFTASEGGVTLNRIGIWNNSQWTALGGGFTTAASTAYAVHRGTDGLIYAAGDFDDTNDLDGFSGVALYNNTTWVRLDMEMPVGYSDVLEVMTDIDNNLYIGYENPSRAGEPMYCAGITTLSNGGTTDCYPVIELTGKATYTWLENQTTGERMYLDMDILENETIIIDTDPESKSITSSWGRDRSSGVLAASDFGSFHLAPGSNIIALFAIDWNYVINGDFHDWAAANNANDWSTSNATETQLTYTSADTFNYTGYSMKITTTGAGGYLYQAINVNPGSIFTFRFRYKTDAANSGAVRYSVYDVTNAADIIAWTNLDDSDASYTLVETTFTVPTDCVQLRLRFGCVDNADNMFIDNIEMYTASSKIYWDILHLAAEGGIT